MFSGFFAVSRQLEGTDNGKTKSIQQFYISPAVLLFRGVVDLGKQFRIFFVMKFYFYNRVSHIWGRILLSVVLVKLAGNGIICINKLQIPNDKSQISSKSQ